ncbi:MAG: GNAT family N-acetyltransferase [Acidobacteriota bacterium]
MAFREIMIRPASLNDADMIRRIYQAALPETATNDEHWEKALRQGGMFIAELEEATIGFGGIDFDATEQIRYVYVIPEYQRSGLQVGLKILQTLEAAARQRGIGLVRLHSTPNAVRFYEKAGYAAVEPGHTIGHDHPGVEMAKDLAPC